VSYEILHVLKPTHWKRLETEPKKRQQTSHAKRKKLNNKNPIKITCLRGVLHIIMNWCFFVILSMFVLFLLVFPGFRLRPLQSHFDASDPNAWRFGDNKKKITARRALGPQNLHF